MTHDTPPKRIWAIEYRGEAVPRSGEWVAEQSDAPEGVNSYTLTSEAEAMVAAVLREASGVAFDAVFDEMNAVFARNTQRRILALIPQPASVALDKLIAEAEARGARAERDRLSRDTFGPGFSEEDIAAIRADAAKGAQK